MLVHKVFKKVSFDRSLALLLRSKPAAASQRDGSRRSRVVAASRRGQQQDFKLSPSVLAASLTAWAAAKSLSLSPLTLSFFSALGFLFFFSFVFPFGLWRGGRSLRLDCWVYIFGLNFIYYFYF